MRVLRALERRARAVAGALFLLFVFEAIALLLLLPMVLVPPPLFFPVLVLTALGVRFVTKKVVAYVSDSGDSVHGAVCSRCGDPCASIQVDGASPSGGPSAVDALVSAVPSDDETSGPVVTDSNFVGRGPSAMERRVNEHYRQAPPSATFRKS
jgi:hypothetical protein